MSRILCFAQFGAAYQCSAERMSSRPSLLKSATATLSLKPGSIICTLKAMSAGRLRPPGAVGAVLGYAFGGGGREPVFVAVAVLSLAAGIGLNTAVFSIINTIFLQS